jgi:hypothetical protein
VVRIATEEMVMRRTGEIDDPSWQDIRDRDDEIRQLKDQLESMTTEMTTRREHANIHYTSSEFIGVDGYGAFSLRQICKDRWEIRMLREKVILFNRRGRRVRADIDNSTPNYDGDW